MSVGRKDSSMDRHFKAVVERDREGRWLVGEVVELPGYPTTLELGGSR